MIVVRCKQCNTEVKSDSHSKSCGCPNMLTVTGDTFTAVDLTSIVVVNNKTELDGFTSQDLQWQEQRRKRKELFNASADGHAVHRRRCLHGLCHGSQWPWLTSGM